MLVLGKISIGILSVSAKETVLLFPRNAYLQVKKNAKTLKSYIAMSATLLFLLVAFEFYYFTKKALRNELF